MIAPINLCGGPPINYHPHPDVDDDASPIHSPRGRSPTFKPCTSAMASGSSAVSSRNASTPDDSNGAITTSSRPPSLYSGTSSPPFPSSTEDGEDQSSTPCDSNATDLEPFPDLDSSEPPLPPSPPPTPPPNPLPTPPPTPPKTPQKPWSGDVCPPRIIKLEPWPPSPPSDSAGLQRGSSTGSRPVRVSGVEATAAPGANPQEPRVRAFGTSGILDQTDRAVTMPNEEQNGGNGEADKDNDDDDCLLCRVGRIYNDPLSPSFVPPQPWPPFISSLSLPLCSLDPTHPFIARAGRSDPRLGPASARYSTTTHPPTPQPTTTQEPARSRAFIPPPSWCRLPPPSGYRFHLRPLDHDHSRPSPIPLPQTTPTKPSTPREPTTATEQRLLRLSSNRNAAPLSPPFATDAEGFDFAEPINVPPAPPPWTLEGRAAVMHSLFAPERQWDQTEAEAWAAEQDRAVWNHVVETNRRREGRSELERERVGTRDRSADQIRSPDHESAGESKHDFKRQDESQDKSGVVYEVLSGEFMAKAYCEGEYERELEEVMNARVNQQSDAEDESELDAGDEDEGERGLNDEDDGERESNDEDEGHQYEYVIDGVGEFRIRRRRRRRSRNEADVEADDRGDGEGVRRINVREYVRFFNSYVAGTAHRGGLGRDSVLPQM